MQGKINFTQHSSLQIHCCVGRNLHEHCQAVPLSRLNFGYSIYKWGFEQPWTVFERSKETDHRGRPTQNYENHPSPFHIFRIARENKWLKFWHVALEYGYDGSKSSLAILNSLCLTVFSDRHCPMQNCTYTVPQGVPFCQHFFECHAEFDSNVTSEYYHGLHPVVHVKLWSVYKSYSTRSATSKSLTFLIIISCLIALIFYFYL